MTVKAPKNAMRKISIWISVVLLLGMTCALLDMGGLPGVLLLLFDGFPLFISIRLAERFMKTIPQLMTAAASVLYGGWFAYIYYDAFYANIDPQSAIAMIFVGICAMPVLIPMWLLAFFIERLRIEK
jgi:hypothetical protein